VQSVVSDNYSETKLLMAIVQRRRRQWPVYPERIRLYRPLDTRENSCHDGYSQERRVHGPCTRDWRGTRLPHEKSWSRQRDGFSGLGSGAWKLSVGIARAWMGESHGVCVADRVCRGTRARFGRRPPPWPGPASQTTSLAQGRRPWAGPVARTGGATPACATGLGPARPTGALALKRDLPRHAPGRPGRVCYFHRKCTNSLP
jgi:hypothetical protein